MEVAAEATKRERERRNSGKHRGCGRRCLPKVQVQVQRISEPEREVRFEKLRQEDVALLLGVCGKGTIVTLQSGDTLSATICERAISISRDLIARRRPLRLFPRILIDFVLGGCTGIGQSLDVGLNKLDLATGLPVLWNASFGWIWEGYKAIQNNELILKASTHHKRNPAWVMCPIRGDLNLSYECMTLFDTNERLIRLCTENPDLWNDFQTKSSRHYCPGDDEEVAEDLEAHEDEEMGVDDSEIPAREVVQHFITKKTGKNRPLWVDVRPTEVWEQLACLADVGQGNYPPSYGAIGKRRRRPTRIPNYKK
ncbi:hypothetical protein B0H13DRAFT_1852042 [Mycena leptocephala]|nr:hypothetical protein B0H13DRAFT_1852042 [Mycena leptocephala]